MLTGPITSFLQMGNGVGSVGVGASLGTVMQRLGPLTDGSTPSPRTLISRFCSTHAGLHFNSCLSSRACRGSPCGVELPLQVTTHRADSPAPDSLPRQSSLGGGMQPDWLSVPFQHLLSGGLRRVTKALFPHQQAGLTRRTAQVKPGSGCTQRTHRRGQTSVLAAEAPS